MTAAASKQIALVEDTIEPLGNRKTDTLAEPPSKLTEGAHNGFSIPAPDTGLFATVKALQMQLACRRLLRRT